MGKFWLLIVILILAVVVLRRRGESTPADYDSQNPTDADIDRLIVAGHKIEAIKAYRLLHGCDLKDAKDAVETRARQLPGAHT